MRLDHLLSKEFLFWNGKKLTVKDSFYRCFGSVFLAKRDGVLKAWHAVGVLEQRSGPDPTDTSDCFFVWLFVWCGCVGCELYSGREHL